MTSTNGPLRRSAENPRYFEDASGAVVWLTGSHTWANFATDQGGTAFDYTAYLDWAVRLGHTFIRGWNWDLPYSRQGPNGGPFRFGPSPFLRTGPGTATDGRPKFDLSQPDPRFFTRLRDRVEQAGRLGLYVSVMLFQGFAWQFDRTDQDGMPYDGRNNVNGVDAGHGGAAATLGDPKVLEAQERYVRWLLDAVGGLDNVLFEVANEAAPTSTEWQHHMIRMLRHEQGSRGLRHPVGMTFQFEGGAEADLRASEADWISPESDEVTRMDPPIADVRQVVVYDSDHGYDWRSLRAGSGAEHRAWVWRCLMRGAGGVLFMDPYLARITIEGETRNAPHGVDPDEPYFGLSPDPVWDALRQAMGHARRFADAIALARLQPRPELADTGWCLAREGEEYAAFLPGPGTMRIAVRPGRYIVRWYEPASGSWSPDAVVDAAGDGAVLTSPLVFDAAVHVVRLAP